MINNIASNKLNVQLLPQVGHYIATNKIWQT